MIDKKRIMRLLKRIKKEYSAERMILFGSLSRGDFHEGSDIDILIIKDTKERFTDRIGKVLELYNGNIALEPIVYTPEEFKRLKNSSFLKQIIKEGISI